MNQGEGLRDVTGKLEDDIWAVTVRHLLYKMTNNVHKEHGDDQVVSITDKIQALG